jgi:hypothetical protein
MYKVVEKKTVKLRMSATYEGVKKFADLDICLSSRDQGKCVSNIVTMTEIHR